jgi:hemoglobin
MSSRLFLLSRSAAFALAPILSACSSHDPASEMATRSLYERLGAEAAIRAVVDDFVGRAAANPAVNFTRKGTSMEWTPSDGNVRHLKEKLVELIAMSAGGPQKYTGRDMASSHAGMRITNAEFDALAGDLLATLAHFKVPQAEQDEPMAVVGSTRKAIVTAP